MRTIKVELVKLVVPGCGALGFYLGAFIGTFLVTRRSSPMSLAAELAVVGLCAMLASFAASTAADAAIGPNASHVDILKLLWRQTLAALALYLLHCAAETWARREVPVFLEHLALWGTGVLTVWADEPGGISWPARKGRRPTGTA